MGAELVRIYLGDCECVEVRATTRYMGVIEGSAERWRVVWRGHTMDGAWSGDARKYTCVEPHDVPAAATPLLRAVWHARYRQSEPLASELTPQQVALLSEAGYRPDGNE